MGRSARGGVADQLADECRVSGDGGHTGCRRCGSKFLYVFKAALNGPHAPPPGRAPAAAAVALRPTRLTPGGWRGEREARRAAAERQVVDRWCGGPAAGRAARPRARAAEGRARRPRRRARGGRGVAVRAPPAGALRLQDGRGTVGRSRSVGGCSEPPRLPSTRASRADHLPTRQGPNLRQGRLDVAGRAAARSPQGRVDGRRDGGVALGAWLGVNPRHHLLEERYTEAAAEDLRAARASGRAPHRRRQRTDSRPHPCRPTLRRSVVRSSACCRSPARASSGRGQSSSP